MGVGVRVGEGGILTMMSMKITRLSLLSSLHAQESL